MDGVDWLGVALASSIKFISSLLMIMMMQLYAVFTEVNYSLMIIFMTHHDNK